MNAAFKKINSLQPIEIAGFVLLALYPVAIISGNLLINVFIFLFSISFFLNFRKEKDFFQNNVFYLLLFFFLSLLLNLFFSLYFEHSVIKVAKVLFIIFFVLEIKRILNSDNKKYMQYVYLAWFIIFLVLSIDVVFEIIFGFNTIGNKSYMPGRISSFFGDELVVGAFYHGFVLFFLSYLMVKKLKNNTMILFIIAVLIISFLIGERSNFIKIFISVIIFSYIALRIDFKIKIISSLVIILSLIGIINFNENYKYRYYEQIKYLFSINGYSKYLKQSRYGAHQNAALKIFQEHKFFGVGIRNFRIESSKKKYENKEYEKTDYRHSTHPHQIHYEILSETGLIGYLSFLIFILISLYLSIKSYMNTKNLFQLSGIIFIVTSLIPILPSGSFWTTFASGIFWLNYAVMASYIKAKF